jgi:hypothetical protein
LVGEEEKKNNALLSRKLNALRFLVCVLVIDGYMEHVPRACLDVKKVWVKFL